MADRRRPNYAIEVERLLIDNMNLEVNLRKADFRKMEIDQEILNLEDSKISTRDLLKNNLEKIAVMKKLAESNKKEEEKEKEEKNE